MLHPCAIVAFYLSCIHCSVHTHSCPRRVPAMPSCTYCIAAIVLCVMLAAIVVLCPPSYTYAEHSATKCILDARGELYPVTYLGYERQNPDGSFYPGDAFYYVFWWRDNSEPGQCGMRPPVLETQGLWLNHTSKMRGAINPETGTAPDAVHHNPRHHSFDPTVKLVESVRFFASDTDDDKICKTMFSKPGESWSIRWQKHTIHDMPFLTKTDGVLKLSDFEVTQAKRSPGKPAWDVWREIGKGSGRGLPDCHEFEKRPVQPIPSYDVTASSSSSSSSSSYAPPADLQYAGYGDIFYSVSHEWQLVYNDTAPHIHDSQNVESDNGTRLAFDGRVSELCGDIMPESGCLYGTAVILPRGGSLCLYSEIERQLGAKWLDNPDKDNDGTDDISEAKMAAENATASSNENWWPPPPQYLPPGVHVSQYVAPAHDVCTSDTDAPLLRLIISGDYWTPHHRISAGGLEYPVRGTIDIIKDKSPPLQNTTLHAILTKPPLLHAGGLHDAQNLDGTYYHNDPIHIRHEPSWMWADERHAHVNFTTERLHTLIPIDDAYDCTSSEQSAQDADRMGSGMCINATDTSSPNWHRQKIQYGNGDGRTIHVADVSFDYDVYTFTYNMTAYNLGRPVATNDAADSINAVLVPYAPVYDVSYAYPVLGDGQEYSFADRRGLVVRYDGSLGGQEYGAPADSMLYAERRSYINDWQETGQGSTIHGNSYYAEPHILDEVRSIKAIKHPDALRPDNVMAAEHAPPEQSAMLLQHGYAAMLWMWNATEFVFEQDHTTPYAEGASRENVTSYLYLWSADFAGKDTPLLESLLRYPEMPFGKQVVVRSVNQSGHIQYQDALEMSIHPYRHGSLNAEYVTDYMADKLMWDTHNDTWIAGAILNDTHAMYQEYGGSGMIDAYILRNSIYFEDHLIEQSDVVNRTYHQGEYSLGDFFLNLTRDAPESIRLSAPMDVGFGALAPTELHLTVNGQKHILRHKYYAFGGTEHIEINVRPDNILDAGRINDNHGSAAGDINHNNSSMLAITPPENFGMITHVMINGTSVAQNCQTGCILSGQSYSALNVTVLNAWGGAAHTILNETIPVIKPEPAEGFVFDDAWITVAALLSVGVLYLVFRRMIRFHD